jgi:hypothetical protein
MILANHGIVSSSGGVISFDADALAFITAASITDNTQKTAVNTLVTDLKTYNIWTKMKAVYPFVGGTASSHKWNLKDPRDLDAAYRLVFVNGWTHSSTGVKPNGTDAYADTKLIPNSAISSVNSMSLSNYSRTSNTSVNGSQMGCYDGVQEVSLYQYYSAILRKGGSMYQYPSEAVLSENPSTQGLQIISRTSSTSAKLFFNNTLLNTNTATRSFALPSRSIYLAAANWATGATQLTPHEHAFDSIGDGLTDTEASNLYTIVQAYQTILGRQI